MCESMNGREREEIRYDILGTKPAVVTFEPCGSEEAHTARSARIVNLSRSGIRLSTPFALSVNQCIRLRLQIEELALDFYVAAEVRWSRPDDNGSHLVGCRFEPGIPSFLLDRLAARGIIDRRTGLRSKAALELRLSAEASRRENAVLLDQSAGGFCILVRCPLALDTRVFLCRKGDRKSFLAGEVRWRLESAQGGYLVGCRLEETAGQ